MTNDEKLAALTAARKSVARSGLSEEDSEHTLVTISLARFQRMNAVIEAAEYALPYYRERVLNSITTVSGYNPYEATLHNLVKTLEDLEKE